MKKCVNNAVSLVGLWIKNTMGCLGSQCKDLSGKVWGSSYEQSWKKDRSKMEHPQFKAMARMLEKQVPEDQGFGTFPKK